MARTAKQRAALRKAQLVSARKRRKGESKRRKYARRAGYVAGGALGLTAASIGGFGYVFGRQLGASRSQSAKAAAKFSVVGTSVVAKRGAKAGYRKSKAGAYHLAAMMTGTGF